MTNPESDQNSGIESQHSTVTPTDTRAKSHRVRFIILALACVLLISGSTFTILAEKARPKPAEALSPLGGDLALIVYQPGLGGFEKEVAQSFGIGLVSAGWSVQMVPASDRAPQDLSSYKLVVVSSPTYWWKPARPVTRWVDNAENLRGKDVVVIGTGSRIFGDSTNELAKELINKDANVVSKLTLESWASHNREGAMSTGEMSAYNLATSISPPSKK